MQTTPIKGHLRGVVVYKNPGYSREIKTLVFGDKAIISNLFKTKNAIFL